jgi:hypothetical protein
MGRGQNIAAVFSENADTLTYFPTYILRAAEGNS